MPATMAKNCYNGTGGLRRRNLKSAFAFPRPNRALHLRRRAFVESKSINYTPVGKRTWVLEVALPESLFPSLHRSALVLLHGV